MLSANAVPHEADRRPLFMGSGEVLTAPGGGNPGLNVPSTTPINTRNDPALNRLWFWLDADARAMLSPLVPVQLGAGDILHQPGAPALQVYLPVTAVVSLVST